MSQSLFKRCPQCGSTDIQMIPGPIGMDSWVCNTCGYRAKGEVPRENANAKK